MGTLYLCIFHLKNKLFLFVCFVVVVFVCFLLCGVVKFCLF